MFIIAIVAFVLTLTLVVGLHEAGHALVAKAFGIGIHRISIGFGKPIVSFQSRSGCEWVWGMWPLGGYVELADSRRQGFDGSRQKAFDKQPVWIRITVLVAGILTNILIAWIALTIYFMMGYTDKPPIIGQTLKGGVADVAGLSKGDKLQSIDGLPMHNWQDIGKFFILNLGDKKVAYQALGTDNKIKKGFFSLQNPSTTKARSVFAYMGMLPDTSTQILLKVPGVGFAAAVQSALSHSWEVLVFTSKALYRVFKGDIPFSFLVGPIGVFTLSAQSLYQGVGVFLFFIANFSIAVAFINILPIPSLDGGSILLALIEKIRGRPVSVALELLLYRLSMIAFFILIVQLAMNDLAHM